MRKKLHVFRLSVALTSIAVGLWAGETNKPYLFCICMIFAICMAL